MSSADPGEQAVEVEARSLRTEVRVTGGERLIVDGSVEEVEKGLSDAARSGQSRLAWFTERNGGEPIALNPAHVVSLRRT